MKAFLLLERMLNCMNAVKYSSFDFALTSYCQAGCPTCARHTLGTSNLKVKLVHMDLKKFENIIFRDLSFWKDKDIIFCGEFGDPMAHPKIKDFIEIIMLTKCTVLRINTNGGIRTPDFYKKLLLKYDKLSFEFGIDGLTNEMNKYRYGVNTNLALRNLNAVAQYNTNNMEDSVVWKYLVFNYNYEQVFDVLKIAKEWNVKKVLIYINNRNYHKITNLNLNSFFSKLKNYDSVEYNYEVVGSYRNEIRMF